MGQFPVLTENRDFRGVYYRGKSCIGPVLVSYVRKNRLGVTRVGITVSKKVGKAVQRNRCRRIIRAAYAELKNGVKPGFDIVFVARGRTVDSKTPTVKETMEKQLRRLQVWQDGRGGGV